MWRTHGQGAEISSNSLAIRTEVIRLAEETLGLPVELDLSERLLAIPEVDEPDFIFLLVRLTDQFGCNGVPRQMDLADVSVESICYYLGLRSQHT